MATRVDQGIASKPKNLMAADAYDRLLSAAALLLLAMVTSALWRGRAHWSEVPIFVWSHVATIVTALALTPILLMRRRGDRLHRQLGWIWCTSLFLTAALSFGIRMINSGSWSWIHLLSAWTMIQVPIIIVAARRHDLKRHRSAVRGMVTGALLIAGIFTFQFERMLGRWLFG